SLTRATASAVVLFIFQLPAISFLRDRDMGVQLSKNATPGKTLPSRNSRLAPPPVEQCVTLSATLNFLAAVAVSPPPTTVVAPCDVASAIASAIAFVDAENLSNSKTPGGPFQTMVFARRIASQKRADDFGPA